MKPTVTPVEVPAESRLSAHLSDAYFHDAYELTREGNSLPIIEMYLDGLSRTPAWVNCLMALRNRVVALVGLKDLGALGSFDQAKPASAYRVGDRLGIFSILQLSDDEIILGDFDRHLDVRVSVCRLGGRDSPRIAVSTVVHIKNLLGKVYMAFVTPLHKRIVPAILSKI